MPVAFCALVYTATSGGFFLVPKPVVLFLSITTLPEKIISLSSWGMANGSCFQWTRSVLTAWPQDMLPQVLPSGLYWKNRWYRPLYQISPLGSFIQFWAGVKWNWGRYCSW